MIFKYFITEAKERSKTPPSRGSKIPLRYKEPKKSVEKNYFSPEPHRPILGETYCNNRANCEQRKKQKKIINNKDEQLPAKILNGSTFSFHQLNHHKRSQSSSERQNSTFNQIPFEFEIEQISKESAMPANSQSLANKKQDNSLEKFESDNNTINVTNLVEIKIKRIANSFGSAPSISNFLEKTEELKIIPNISQLNHTKDLFSKMIFGIQRIRIRNYLPNDLDCLSNPNIQKRFKSMKQVRSFELAINYMQNEFDAFNSKVLKLSENFDQSLNEKIEALNKENEKLKEKVDNLRKQIKELNDIFQRNQNERKKEIILQIQQLIMKIDNEKEKNADEITGIYDKIEKFSESREKLLSSYSLVNQQIKKLEKAKFSIMEKNAKTVTIKGKVYNEKMIDDEIAQFIFKKENILTGLVKIETHEKKILSVLK